jgi:hypothetical protein
MRETRSSGSVEGVMSNRDPYSDSTRAFMVGFGTTKFTRAWEPALLWNQ